jgi:hypothetical protein
VATKLALYNDALLALGQERLATTADAVSARYALDDAYDKALAWCLEQGYWNFAMRAVELTSTPSIDPAFGFTYAVTKPDDWVRSHSISASETFDPPLLQYNDENGLWYVNVDPLFVRYVSNDTDYGLDLSLWPETFANYVALRLAVKTCKRITGTNPDDAMFKQEKRALADARSKDAMNEPPGFPPRGTWVSSRRHGSSSTRWDRQN